MTSVVVARIASAIGSESDSAFCWSRKPARLPADAHGHRRVDRADVAHQLLGLLVERAAAGDEVDPVEAVGLLHARRADDAGQRAEPLRVALDRRAVAGTALRRDVDRARAAGRELRLERVVDDARRLVARQHARVDAGELDAQERDPEHDQQRGGADRDRHRAAHDQVREPVPEAAALAGGVAVQRRLEAPRAERVHARAERGEDRRQQRQRDERRHQRADHPADAHRVEEAQREHEQRGQRRRDRDRGEQHGAARRRHRRAQAPGRSRARARAPRGSARP